ncbi:MAG: APC family permease [Kiloniellales bacterium]
MSLPIITLYGLGTTIGAGIYVLIGKVAGEAGLFAPLSFLIAAGLAGLSAFSFAELSSRLPKSAGEAVYVREGLGRRRLAVAVGLLVVLAGTVSAAAVIVGAAGYIQFYVPAPQTAIVVVAGLALGLVAAWGINESVGAVALFTLLEIAGLILVIWAGTFGPALSAEPLPEAMAAPQGAAWGGILAASILAFFAFIGFEDMVNVAEEVRDVSRTLPAAIILTLVITTLMYVAISVVAVLAVPIAELEASKAPLALIYARGTGSSPAVIVAIGIFATLNGALIQVVMGSRILYGLSAQGWLPAGLGKVSARTRTPVLATGLVTAAVLALALWFPIQNLAQATSLITLTVFALVNLSLLRIKRRDPRPAGVAVFPSWLPAGGFIASTAFVVLEFIRLLQA